MVAAAGNRVETLHRSAFGGAGPSAGTRRLALAER